MTNAGTMSGDFTKESDREIVVDLRYVELVAEHLSQFDRGARPHPDKQSTVLGLGVVSLPGLEAAAATLRTLREERAARVLRAVHGPERAAEPAAAPCARVERAQRARRLKRAAAHDVRQRSAAEDLARPARGRDHHTR